VRQENLARELQAKLAAKMEELDEFQQHATSSVAYATAEAERMGRDAAELAESQASLHTHGPHAPEWTDLVGWPVNSGRVGESSVHIW